MTPTIRPLARCAAAVRTTTALFIVVVSVFAAGCSDDVVCPNLTPAGAVPYISAVLSQSSSGLEGQTHAELVCAADPLPVQLIAFLNGRTLVDAGTTDGLTRVATLDDDMVVFQPGVRCSLEVTTDYGYATSGAFVPDPAAATAPDEVGLGDALTISWTEAPHADYYTVSASLSQVRDSTRGGTRDTLTFTVTTREASIMFDAEDITSSGDFIGTVESVAGPYPEVGVEGNVLGDGWGHFTIRYSDAGSSFAVTITDDE